MKTFDLNRSTARDYIDRINGLSADSERQWGTMSVEQMFRHVRLSIQTTLGEIEVEDKSTLFFRLVRPLLDSGILAKPKGKVDAPSEYVVDSSDGFETEKAELLGAIDRFLKLCDDAPDVKRRHPFFGMLSMRQWKRNHGMHLQYHLEQFGA